MNKTVLRFHAWVAAIALAVVVATFMVNAEADDKVYGIIGGGIAEHKMDQGDGHWRQNAFGQDFDTTSPTYTLGLGLKLNDKWAVELDYRDLGGMSGALNAVSDRNYKACQCSPSGEFHHWYIESDVSGIGLSALYRPWKGLLLRAGLFKHRSKFDAHKFTAGGRLKNAGPGSYTPFDDHGVNPMFGIGYAMGDVRFEYTLFHNVGAGQAAAINISTVTATVTF